MGVSMYTLYGLKNCDTCKKALKSLDAAGKQVRFVDIRQDADLASKVPYWLENLDPKKVLNARSTTWRGLSDAEKASAEGEGLAGLLIENPTLIKRPIIEADDYLSVGWNKEVELALT